jgi:hypothetical protein
MRLPEQLGHIARAGVARQISELVEDQDVGPGVEPLRRSEAARRRSVRARVGEKALQVLAYAADSTRTTGRTLDRQFTGPGRCPDRERATGRRERDRTSPPRS